jgi:hypothetical protein
MHVLDQALWLCDIGDFTTAKAAVQCTLLGPAGARSCILAWTFLALLDDAYPEVAVMPSMTNPMMTPFLHNIVSVPTINDRAWDAYISYLTDCRKHSPSSQALVGAWWQNHNQPTLAWDHFEMAAKAKSVLAAIRMGLMQLNVAQHNQAISYLQLALKLDPTNASAAYHLWQIHQQFCIPSKDVAWLNTLVKFRHPLREEVLMAAYNDQSVPRKTIVDCMTLLASQGSALACAKMDIIVAFQSK